MAGIDPIVLYDAKESLARVTLNRPGQRNALSAALVRDLSETLVRAGEDPEVRVVILSSVGGDAFCVGGDLDELGRPAGEFTGHEDRGAYAELLRTLAGLGKPVLARVNGACLSAGLGLALACDLVVASNDSTFGTPEVTHGLMPMMTMAPLIRNCGRKKAVELILTGLPISAREAERLGLINQAVPVEDLDAAVDALAERLASLSPMALRLGRDALHTMADLEFQNALSYLQTMSSLNLATADAQEGLRARREKRAPRWSGQ